MQRSERLSQVLENVIFNSSDNEFLPRESSEAPEDIMDIPGTPHEILQKLSEMV